VLNVSIPLKENNVSGHANMVPRGSDIVCAIVTAITVTPYYRGLKISLI